MAFAYFKNLDENTVILLTKQWVDEQSPFCIKQTQLDRSPYCHTPSITASVHSSSLSACKGQGVLPRRSHTLAGGLRSQGAGCKTSALSSHSFSAHTSQTRWVHWETGLQLEKDSSLWFLYNVVSTQLHSNKSLVSSYGEWKER